MQRFSIQPDANELLYKAETDSQAQVCIKYMVTKGENGGRGIQIQEFGINDIHTYKQIINKDLLYSTGNSTQHSAMTNMRKESGKEWVCVCIKLNHSAVHLKHETVNQLYSNLK